jgi:Tol biopolymer transport system component
VAWLKDGNGLVVTAKEQASSPTQIWYLTYPGGEVHRITNDLNDYHSTSLTADSMALATVQSDVVSHIWVAPNGQASRASQVSSGKFDGLEEISWTPDNKIVYSSSAGGNSDIWIMDADGSNQKQLTANAGRNALPSVSPNGRYIVFISNRAGNPNIWRMDIDGSSPKQLTNGSGENCPHFTPAGDWVVYNSFPSKVVLWKVPIDGGNPVQLTDAPSWRPVVSPDGKMIACNYFVEHSGWKMVIIPFAGGQPTKIFDTYRDAFGWTPDGRALAYIDSRGLSNITSQPTNGSPSKHLTEFNDGRIFAFAWSQDGKQLALARGMVTNDVVLINGIRNQQ